MRDRRILLSVVGYLYFQIVINTVMLLSFFILVEHPFINLDPDIGKPGIWFISLSFTVAHIVINLYIRMRWKRSALNDPKPYHWTLGYVIYVIPVILICFF